MANLPYADMIDLLRRRGVGMDAQDPKTVQQPTIVPPQRVNPVLPEASPAPTGEDQLPPAAPVQTSGPVQIQTRALSQAGTPPPVPKFQPLVFSKSGSPSISPTAEGNPVEIEQMYQRALDKQKTPKWKDVASGIIQGAAAMGGNAPQYPVDISGKDVRMRESMGRLQRELGVQKEQAQIEAQKSVPYYRAAQLSLSGRRLDQGDVRNQQGQAKIDNLVLYRHQKMIQAAMNSKDGFDPDNNPKDAQIAAAADVAHVPWRRRAPGAEYLKWHEGTDPETGAAKYDLINTASQTVTPMEGTDLPEETERQQDRKQRQAISADQIAQRDRGIHAANSRFYAGLGQKEANELRDRHDKISKVAGEYASYQQLANDPSTPKANRAGLRAAADGRRKQLENSGLYDFDSNGNATPKSIPSAGATKASAPPTTHGFSLSGWMRENPGKTEDDARAFHDSSDKYKSYKIIP